MQKVVILAGGKSTRIGFPKLMLARQGVPLITRMITDLTRAGWGAVSVVISESELEEFVKSIEADADILFNPAPERGMIGSLRLGLDWAGNNVDGILAWPVDHPLVNAATLETVRSLAQSDRIVIPTYQNRRGHPTWWGRSSWDALKSPVADMGAREVLRSGRLMIEEIVVDDESVLRNINTVDEAKSLGLERYKFKT